MIGNYTSKHMICVHKSAFSAVSATRRSEKLSLLGTDPQTPRIEKYVQKIFLKDGLLKGKIDGESYKTDTNKILRDRAGT